jgi:hypothetical protein
LSSSFNLFSSLKLLPTTDLSKQQSNLTIKIFSNPIYYDKPSWERIAYGYRNDGDLSFLYDIFRSQSQRNPENSTLVVPSKV